MFFSRVQSPLSPSLVAQSTSGSVKAWSFDESGENIRPIWDNVSIGNYPLIKDYSEFRSGVTKAAADSMAALQGTSVIINAQSNTGTFTELLDIVPDIVVLNPTSNNGTGTNIITAGTPIQWNANPKPGAKVVIVYKHKTPLAGPNAVSMTTSIITDDDGYYKILPSDLQSIPFGQEVFLTVIRSDYKLVPVPNGALKDRYLLASICHDSGHVIRK